MEQYDQQSTSSPTASLLTRAFMFLEDGDWKSADAYCERILDTEPQNAYAWLGKLMAELKVRNREGLQYCKKPFDDSANYQKAVRFGDEALVAELTGYISAMKAQKVGEKAKSNGKTGIMIVAAALVLCVGLLVAVLLTKKTNTPEAKKLQLQETATEEATEIPTEEITERVTEIPTEEITEAYTEPVTEPPTEPIRVGDYITFGRYEQDNDLSNGQEEIEWQVLDVQDGKALVISKYGLDCQPYNTEWEDVTWETCTLRSWLNNEFINAAFSAEEQEKIPTVTVSADKNLDCDTDPGNATQDQIFLLSIPEVIKYCFSSNAELICTPTDYAVENGVYTNSGACWWWLRSPGYNQVTAASVGTDGGIGSGADVSDDSHAVRPAMWITLEE